MSQQQGGVTTAEVDAAIRAGLEVEKLIIVDASAGCGEEFIDSRKRGGLWRCKVEASGVSHPLFPCNVVCRQAPSLNCTSPPPSSTA
jgi:hypothetical protein